MSQNIAVYSQYPGGNQWALITQIAPLKPTNGCLYRLLVQTAGSGGNLEISDLAALPYSASTTYMVGQAVVYSGAVYYCILASLGNLPTNATYFNQTIPTGVTPIIIPNADLTVTGIPITLDWPFRNGILVSAVPAGSPVIAASYF
jgi:hypothetical protein